MQKLQYVKPSKEVLWLKSKAKFLKINGLEIELGMSNSTLRHYLTSTREMTPENHQKVIDWVRKFKK